MIQLSVEQYLSEEFDTEISVYEIMWSETGSQIGVEAHTLQTFMSMSELESVVTEVVDETVGDVARTACVDTLP